MPTYSRANVQTPNLSRKAYIWLAEILGTALRDSETVPALIDRITRKELPGTNPQFQADTFAEAVRQFSK